VPYSENPGKIAGAAAADFVMSQHSGCVDTHGLHIIFPGRSQNECQIDHLPLSPYFSHHTHPFNGPFPGLGPDEPVPER